MRSDCRQERFLAVWLQASYVCSLLFKMQIMVTISKGCVCVKWDNPCKTLSTVPGTAVFIKCYHSLIPKDTQTFRDSDLDSAMLCPSFHIPQCFDHLLKKSPFQGFALQTDLVRIIPHILFPVHTLIWKTILSTATSCLKKISLYEQVCPGPGGQKMSVPFICDSWHHNYKFLIQVTLGIAATV